MQNLPTKLYTAQQSRQLDRIAIEEYGLSGISLMLKAATAVCQEIRKRWSFAANVSVFCGAGNNAGDGYLTAILSLKTGLNVCVYSLVAPEKLTGNALTAYQTYKQAGGKVEPFSPAIKLEDQILVDALLGTGLNRNVSNLYAQAINIINNSRCPVIAVDIPSGLNADTGRIMSCAVKADVTVSFIALKQGLFTAEGLECCGEVVFADLDVPAEIFTRFAYSAELLQKTTLPPRDRNSHKGSFGHLLVIGGEVGFCGAARLAAEAGLRSGAGLVSIATREAHANLLNSGRFELMCHPVDEVLNLQSLLNKATAIVLGTGLGQNKWGIELFKTVIGTRKPLVIDADGLNILATTEEHHIGNRFFLNDFDHNPNWILTPHPGEAARLLKCTTAEVNADRFAAVKKIQAIYGGVVVLKGAGSLIFDSEELFVSTTGNPGMASGGMGDVLAGIIGGLIAQDFSLIQAAKTAVYLHGLAADLAAAQDGERGLLASDLMPFIRKLVN